MDFAEQQQKYIELVESGLKRYVPSPETRPVRLHQAMAHSLAAGGKRIRPMFVLAGHAMHPSTLDPLPAAVAVECIHTYSLIHDDLPCMDDSPLRRGQPSCHVAYDEATALLAGDALLTHAFDLLAREYAASPAVGMALIVELGLAAGSQRLIGGQMADIIAETSPPDAEELDYIHQNKTAALLTACLVMGVTLSDAGSDAVELARTAGKAVGLAFQIIDDILDASGDAASLGKNTGQDADKITYVKMHGIEASRAKAKELTGSAVSAIEKIGGENAFLLELVRQLETRIS